MKLSGLGSNDVEIGNEEVLSDGFLKLSKYSIRHGLFNGGKSNTLDREAIVRPPSVGVLLFDPIRDVVVLVEQFRMGPYLANDDPWLLEVVAGISEPGEALEEVAHREVEEEANCHVTQLLPVTDVYLSPGAATEKMMIYCGIVDSSKAGGVYGLDEEGEDIKVHTMPLEQAYSMVKDGRIDNAPSIIAIQWLKLNHDEVLNSAKT